MDRGPASVPVGASQGRPRPQQRFAVVAARLPEPGHGLGSRGGTGAQRLLVPEGSFCTGQVAGDQADADLKTPACDCLGVLSDQGISNLLG